MENFFKDIRYGFRGLIKRPAFTVIALVILALGIGANTAIFTLINAVVLKSLPVDKPAELVLFNDTSDEGTSILSEGDVPAGRSRRVFFAKYPYFFRHQSSFLGKMTLPPGGSRL